MNMKNSCVLCVLNQILRVSAFLNCSEAITNDIFHQALDKIPRMNFLSMTAPEFAEHIYDIFIKVSGVQDPYKGLRKEQNMMVMNKIGYFRDEITRSNDPLFTAVFYALIGNMIDYGGVELYDDVDLFKKYQSLQLTLNDFSAFRDRLLTGKQILVLADNAGEAVFDLLLLEQMKKVNPQAVFFYGVRSKPAINDVLKDDAEFIGINQYATIMETGSTFAGTRVVKSSSDFKAVYHAADLIISKGQGNFETMEAEAENILFAFKVKCDVVARYTGLERGDLVFAFRSTIFQF
ncbi:MAG: DUF89 family protein [Candidatus Aminicenantes bacterium]|nr:DUF89 family protein [Candidatus Aminicenantes bacterium]